VPSTFDLFNQAERIEQVAAAMYAALARQFRNDDVAHALFVRLENEEQQHAARIRLLAGSYRNDSKLVERVAGAEELGACLAAAQRALGEIQGGGWPLELREVKVRLALLEAQLARAHAHVIGHNADPGLREFFARLAEQDAAHAELLDPPQRRV
jgi:rubrerythrin